MVRMSDINEDILVVRSLSIRITISVMSISLFLKKSGIVKIMG